MTNDEQERLVIVPKSVFDNLGEIGKQLENLDLHLQALVAMVFMNMIVLVKANGASITFKDPDPKTKEQKEVVRILKEFGVTLEED